MTPPDNTWKPDTKTFYSCYTLATGEQRAREMFRNRHGYEAQECHEYMGILWLGPVEHER